MEEMRKYHLKVTLSESCANSQFDFGSKMRRSEFYGLSILVACWGETL
jgi:hypothetical protein